jgi:hypothetical protein
MIAEYRHRLANTSLAARRYHYSQQATGESLMAGMLQILTYLLSFYLIVKGIEILQIGLASNRPKRSGIITFGALMLVACIIAAFGFSYLQDQQATSMSQSSRSFTP